MSDSRTVHLNPSEARPAMGSSPKRKPLLRAKFLTTPLLAGLLAASLVGSARADITSGLVGVWAFDEGSGSTAADTSGNSNPGTLTNFADTAFTSMWTTNGWFTNAVLFNQNGETSNYVSVADAGSFTFSDTKAFTLAAWVKLSTTSQGSSGAIVCKGSGGGGEEYCLDVYSGKFRFYVRPSSGSTKNVSSVLSPSANTWYHVVCTFSAVAPQVETVYINGQANASAATPLLTSLASNTHVVSIGSREQSATSGYNYGFKGTIDDVHIYNRALSAADVWELYSTNGRMPLITTQPRNVNCYSNDTATFVVKVDASKALQPISYQWLLDGTNVTGATSASLVLRNVTSSNAGPYSVIVSNAVGAQVSASALLTVQALPAPDLTRGRVGYWRLDDPSGSATAADASGYGNAGTLNGFADGTFASMWGRGWLGGALTFNSDGWGSDVLAVPGVGTPAPASLDFSASPAFSLAGWVNGSLTQISGAAIFAKGTGNGGEQFVLDVYGGKYRFFVRDTNAVVYTATASVGPNGYWQHVAAVLNATNGILNCYVDGVLAASAAAPLSLLASSHEVSIGNRQPGTDVYANAFTGALDDVRIYNRDLTSAEVSALYAAAAAPQMSVTPPIGYTNVLTKFVGGSAAFSVNAWGAAPLGYQWTTNGVAIPGAISPSLTLSNLALGTLTTVCTVTNAAGSAATTWRVNVIPPPTTPYPQAVLADHPLGYWRLNEADNSQGNGNAGMVCADYVGGHDGLYTNVTLGNSSYSSATDPNTTSALFGESGLAGNINSFVGHIPGIGFAAPAGTSVNFSVEAWVNCVVSPAAATLFTQGEYGVDDAMVLDFTASGSTPYKYRFYIRYANGQVANAVSTVAPDGAWHHFVGVCDQTDGYLNLYMDGQVIATTSVAPGMGLYAAANPSFILGSGTKDAVSYSQQYQGQMSEVALYDYALSTNQVRTHFNASGMAPVVSLPGGVDVSQGGTLSVTGTLTAGTLPVFYSWTPASTGTVLPNQTNLTLVVSNLTMSDSYTLTASNLFGVTSASVTANVISGGPQLYGDTTPRSLTVYAGTPVTFSVTAYGTLPLYYQWFNGTTPVAGATNTTYTVAAAVGTNAYSCTISNTVNGGSLLSSTPATLVAVPAPTSLYARTVLSNTPAAYWRLDERDNAQNNGNAGVIAYDYVGQHHALYNGVNLGAAGYLAMDPDTAASFGVFTTPNSYAGEIDNASSGLPNLNFAQTAIGGNAQFSVEAWVKTTAAQADGAGIVTKGYGSGGEQFALDCQNNQFRFFIHDGAGVTRTCQSSVTVNDGKWHHVVGVCDERGTLAYLYVDGVEAARTAIQGGKNVVDPTGAAVAAADLVSIGARASSQSAATMDYQFVGTIDEVALYNAALSAAQVAAHYQAVVPLNVTLTVQPSGGNLILGWPQGTLLAAPTPTGPWTNVPNATPPSCTVTPSAAQLFYRVLVR